jgi:drug/metabolite transporter (DMT)-like permease
MTLSGPLKGFLFILTADLLWGLSGSVAKYLFSRQVSPFDLVQVRLILSFVLLVACLLLYNPALLKISRRDIPYMLLLGTLGVATVQFSYLYTISQTNVATAVFLEYLAPVFILLYGLLFHREKIGPARLMALFGAIAGGFLMVKGTTGAGMAVTVPGLISGLVSAVSFAFYTVYGKYGLSKYSPWTLLAWGMGVGGAAWALYKPPWISLAAYGTAADWLFFLYIAVFATILPFGFFFKGLKYLSPVVAGITSTMEPVLAGIISFLLLGEVLTPMQMAGCALILSAVILLQLRTGEQPEAPAVSGKKAVDMESN